MHRLFAVSFLKFAINFVWNEFLGYLKSVFLKFSIRFVENGIKIATLVICSQCFQIIDQMSMIIMLKVLHSFFETVF